MDKGFTRTGRRSKYGAVRNSLEDGKQSAPEMVNGGSEKSKSTDSGNDDWVENDKSLSIKIEVDEELLDKSDKGHSTDDSKMSNSTTESEFHGFDRPSTPSAFTIVNELVGRYKADVGDDDEKGNVNEEDDNDEKDDVDVDNEDDSPALGSPGQKKMRVQDVYTDSEDDSPKPVKETREPRITPKKRPLAQLEAFEEKPASPPPAKRARKKSAKAREAAGDSLDNMRLLSDVSSEVTSSVDVSSKSKAHKDDSVSVEVTSSASTPVSVKKETPGSGRARPSRPTPDMSNPLFIKPLHSGWRRELVYRQTETTGGKRSGDIYYYTPIGKKVRSKIELAQYLKGSEFTLDNFTFTKEPLDVDDPSKQIIREASTRKAFASSGGADSHTPKKEKTPKLPKTPRVSKISSPAEAPVSSEDNVVASGPPSATTSPSTGSTPAASKGSGTPRVALKTPKQNSKPGPKVKVTPVRKSNADSPTSKASSKGSRIKKESSDEGELEIGMLPPNWDPSASHMGDRSTANTTVTWKSKSKRGKGADNGDGADSVTTGTGTVQIHHTMANFMSELSVGYAALFHVMEYLKVQELLRASRVCRLWRDLSLHPKLWHTVRMKNSQVCDWDGFAAALRARGTRVLDLRKMLTSAKPDDIERMWKEFCSVIEQADNLQRIDLSRCPASVVEQLARSCPQLRVINAIAIRSEEINLESLNNVPLLEELRLKGTNGMKIVSTLESLMSTRLRHLSLLSVRNIQECNVNSLGDLHNLESLELGDCEGISDDFGPEHLVKLTKLKRLRLEKGPVPTCPVNSILEGVSKLPLLEQLEIINFDVKPGFDKALGMCKQVQRLLIIPTYITTSASTNHIVLSCLPLFADSLSHLVWGLTQELTRVTDLFIDQCEARKGSEGAPKLNAFPGECIPIIRPVLVGDKDKQKKTEENGEDIKDEKKDEEEGAEKDADKEEKMEVDEEKNDAGNKEDKSNKSHKEKDETSSPYVDDVEALARGFRAVSCMDEEEQNKLTQPATPPVSILPIPKLKKLLVQLLPNTRVKILKVPFPSTWRQTFPELSHF